MEARLLRLENTKHLRDYPGYGVDTEGNVWSFKYNKPRILSPGWKKKNHGYKTVLLTDKTGKKTNFLIHRLVALHFIPNPENKPEVNHIGKDENGIITKLDNRACSLEWATRPENIRHGFINGLIKTPKGEKAHNCTLTNEQVLFIFNHKGSPRQLCRDLKMPYSKIASIRNGVSWNHVTGAPKKYYGKEKSKTRYTTI